MHFAYTTASSYQDRPARMNVQLPDVQGMCREMAAPDKMLLRCIQDKRGTQPHRKLLLHIAIPSILCPFCRGMKHLMQRFVRLSITTSRRGTISIGLLWNHSLLACGESNAWLNLKTGQPHIGTLVPGHLSTLHQHSAAFGTVRLHQICSGIRLGAHAFGSPHVYSGCVSVQIW